MLRVLVGHSYFLKLDPKQLARAKPYPPLATLQAAAVLREAGHDVALFDAMLADPGDFGARVAAAQPRLFVLYEDNYNFLTKMCLGQMRLAARAMVRTARRAGARVIVAGSDETDDPRPYLQAGADAVLSGEGLGALRWLAARLDEHPDLSPCELAAGIPGVVPRHARRAAQSRTARAQARHPQAVQPQPARSLPTLPAWDLIDVDGYRSMWRAAHGYFSLNMAASRGCSFRCAWCAKPIWGSRYLQRDAGEVAAELAYLHRTFAPDHIWFADDIFGFRVDWVQAFASSARAAGVRVPFTIQTRADLVSARMAAALAEAGCREVWLGAESGSQRILDAMRKGLEVGAILAARERLKSAGIRVGFFIQLGYLGEELEDLLATRELIETACPDEIGVSVAYPLPGTPFFERVKSELGAKTHWRDSGELAMMFHGTYTTELYRAVRDLLHEQVELQHAGHPADERGRRALDARWQSLVARAGELRHGHAMEGRAING